ncbi:hypothetical protein [Mesobacillus stamsii]|uniref:Uncharacterized protein n=1 Tax=Mesobacillus stamsii TaxID=225347 RepID=A0ABU0FSL1_9BACI|nr:hypothetical protein [Mesobacillus stamsii]MDQ0412907.1 hypothetical protein [Mesobacillus stamsii]
MKKNIDQSMNEIKVKRNVIKTAMYLLDAFCNEDYESAKLELEEIQIAFKCLEDLEIKRKRREELASLVVNMKSRGIKIDYANCFSFFEPDEKNAVEASRKTSNIDKKRQQA